MKISKLLLFVLLGVAAYSDAKAQLTCASLDGAYVISQGYISTYLGFFGSADADESIMNPYGEYGSELPSYSLRNPNGPYGNPDSKYSPFDPNSRESPRILRGASFIAYLTVNPLRTPRVSLAEIDASCTFYSAEADRLGGGVTPYTLSVSTTGSGNGTVTSSPSGMNCGTTCNASFATGTNVTLTAQPANGSTFTGWGGACAAAGTSATCDGILGQSLNVTASFNLTAVSKYALSISKSGSGSGTVTSNPSGINCGNACGAGFDSGTDVTLTANPASGSTFGGWSGPCTGTGTCSVSMTQARSVTASFLASGLTGVTTAYSGIWSNPAQDGHGFSISILSATRAIVYWYTYDPLGAAVWIMGDGEIIGNVIKSKAYSFQGMQFGTWDPADRQDYDWGTFEIEFDSCDSATFRYNSTLAYEGGEEFGSGTFPITRIASIDGLKCGDVASATPIVTTPMTDSGIWSNPAQDGHGFSISVISATRAIVYWYTYDPFGNALWIMGDGQIMGNEIKAKAYFLQGMQFGTWNPADRQDFDWGTFEMDFDSCNSATFRYNSTLAYEGGEEFGSGTFPIARVVSIDGLDCQ